MKLKNKKVKANHVKNEVQWCSCTDPGDLLFNWKIFSQSKDCYKFVFAHYVFQLMALNHLKAFYFSLSSIRFKINKFELKLNMNKNIFPNSKMLLVGLIGVIALRLIILIYSSSYPEAKFVGDFGPTPYEIHVNSQSQK